MRSYTDLAHDFYRLNASIIRQVGYQCLCAKADITLEAARARWQIDNLSEAFLFIEQAIRVTSEAPRLWRGLNLA